MFSYYFGCSLSFVHSESHFIFVFPSSSFFFVKLKTENAECVSIDLQEKPKKIYILFEMKRNLYNIFAFAIFTNEEWDKNKMNKRNSG